MSPTVPPPKQKLPSGPMPVTDPPSVSISSQEPKNKETTTQEETDPSDPNDSSKPNYNESTNQEEAADIKIRISGGSSKPYTIEIPENKNENKTIKLTIEIKEKKVTETPEQ